MNAASLFHCSSEKTGLRIFGVQCCDQPCAVAVLLKVALPIKNKALENFVLRTWHQSDNLQHDVCAASETVSFWEFCLLPMCEICIQVSCNLCAPRALAKVTGTITQMDSFCCPLPDRLKVCSWCPIMCCTTHQWLLTSWAVLLDVAIAGLSRTTKLRYFHLGVFQVIMLPTLSSSPASTIPKAISPFC
jgi:hypothetical protein